MKNKFNIYLIIFLILISSVLAADIEVKSIKFYNNGIKVSTMDQDGGDMNVVRSDVIDAVINVGNNRNNITQVKLFSRIDSINNGDSMEKTLDWFDIQATDSRTKTLSFVVPEAAPFDTYDWYITVYYRKNSTAVINSVKYDWQITVQDKNNIVQNFDLQKTFVNLTIQQSHLLKTLSECYGYIGMYSNKSKDLAQCKEEVGTRKGNEDSLGRENSALKTERSGLNDQLASCKNSVTSYSNQIAQLQSNCITVPACNNQTSTQIQKVKKENQNMILIIGACVIGGALLITNKNKKKNISSQMGLR